MKSYLASMFSAQTPPPGSQEGLPYWILWFLLCVILLLFTFIFLRDKDLRHRLNQFLFGAKKRLIKFRLHTRLKIAHRKKSDIHRELGQKVWEDRVDISEGNKTSGTIQKLEDKRILLQEDLGATQERISRLEKNLADKSLKSGMRITGKKTEIKAKNEKLSEIKDGIKEIKSSLSQKKHEADKVDKDLNSLYKKSLGTDKLTPSEGAEIKQKPGKSNHLKEELEKLQRQIKGDIEKLRHQIDNRESEEKAIKGLIHDEIRGSKEFEAESKREEDEIKKEIQEWIKHKIKIQDKIQRIEKRKVPLFISLGSLADENRNENENLVLYYSRIDRINKKIDDIEKQLEELG